MGYRGQFTRVTGPAHHSLITYTAIDTPKADLPEKQLSLHDLISIYKIKRLSASAKIYALIGNPIDLSVSQYTHNDFFAYNGKNSVYLKLQLEEFELKTFFQQLKELRVAGLSITMPFKEAVLPYLDCLSDEVLACGACNTVLVRDAKLYGFNTDGAGAVNALRKVIALTGKRVVILGAGGAAKAIAASLAKNGAQVAFVSRSFTRAQQTAKQIDVQAFKTVGEYDILINCTPVKDPLPANEILAKTVVFDINTANVNSPFLKAARQKGCLIIYGYELFLEQAKLQFKIWDR